MSRVFRGSIMRVQLVLAVVRAGTGSTCSISAVSAAQTPSTRSTSAVSAAILSVLEVRIAHDTPEYEVYHLHRCSQ